MADLLTPEDSAEAARLGWRVVEVYDLKTRKLVAALVPSRAMQRWDSAALMNAVKELARQNHAAAVSTLRVLVRAPMKRGKQ